jgi:hypothetical protein
MRKQSMSWGSRALAALPVIAAFLALGALPKEARGDDRLEGARVPARIANHYNHKAYQPTTKQVCSAARSASINCSSKAGQEAETELDEIQRQISDIDKRYPPGFLSKP